MKLNLMQSDFKIVNRVMVGQLRNDSCLLEVKFQGRQSLIAAFFGTQLGGEEEEEMCLSGNFFIWLSVSEPILIVNETQKKRFCCSQIKSTVGPRLGDQLACFSTAVENIF